MELPITIVIILFVAVAVSVGIIGFAGSSIDNAENQVSNMGRDKDTRTIEDGYVEVSGDISQNQVRNLGEQCVRDMVLSSTIKRTLCYAVKGDGIDSMTSLNGETFTFNDVEWEFNVDVDTSQSLFIYYNPLGTIDVNT